MVGAVRFELTTSWTRTKRASQATLRPEPGRRRCPLPPTIATMIFAPAPSGCIVRVPTCSAASGRPLRTWNAPPTRSLERLRYVAHAFQRAGSGGFPAARWRYCRVAPPCPAALPRKKSAQAAVLISQSPGAFPSGTCQEKRQRTRRASAHPNLLFCFPAVPEAVAPRHRPRRVHGSNACGKRNKAFHESPVPSGYRLG